MHMSQRREDDEGWTGLEDENLKYLFGTGDGVENMGAGTCGLKRADRSSLHVEFVCDHVVYSRGVEAPWNLEEHGNHHPRCVDRGL